MNKGVVGRCGAGAEAERRADVKTCGLCAVQKGQDLALRVRWGATGQVCPDQASSCWCGMRGWRGGGPGSQAGAFGQWSWAEMGCEEESGLEAGGEVWLLGERGRGLGSLGLLAWVTGSAGTPTGDGAGGLHFSHCGTSSPLTLPPPAGGLGQRQVGTDLGGGGGGRG